MVLSDNVIFGRYPSYNLHSSQLGQSRKEPFLHALTFLYLGKILFLFIYFYATRTLNSISRKRQTQNVIVNTLFLKQLPSAYFFLKSGY